MTLLSEKFQELKRVSRLTANWLIYTILGESALTQEEVDELNSYGKLPMGRVVGLADKSYLLGRLKATMRKNEYETLSYEELDSQVASLSSLEDLVLDQIKLKVSQHLKLAAEDVMASATDSVVGALEKTVNEAITKQVLTDELSLAALNKKTVQQVVSTLSTKLKSQEKKNWKVIVQTELHSAKMAAVAQAIVNKHDIYALSDGVESAVSIVPAPGCDDCKFHYLDSNGQPKILLLKDLLQAGDNKESDHSREGGLHTGWKVTLPPLHPNCCCQLVYVPPGHSWNAGKLELLNKSLFEEHLIKARSGVSGGISSSVTPKGPPQTAKPPTTPSVAGVAAPGNVAGPGKPRGMAPSSPFSKIGGGGGKTGGGGLQYMGCPFGGGADCIKHGGNGAAQHKAGGSIMKAHQEAMARGAQPKTPQAKEAHQKQMEVGAKLFNAEPHSSQVVKDHLAEGTIGSIRKLGGTEAGVNASYKITIVGNGSGCMKPPMDVSNSPMHLKAAGLVGEKLAKATPEEKEKALDELPYAGAGTLPKGINPKAEVGAHKLSESLGIGLVPVTTMRHSDGKDDSPVGLTSVQHWQDDAVDMKEYSKASSSYEDVMKAAPKEHKDKLHEQFASIAVMDVIQNNNDRHFGNLKIHPKKHDLVAIDHGVCFGNGMSGHRNDIATKMAKAGVALQIPPKLHQRLKAQSLDDTMKSLDESGLPDWMKAQTFLRAKYVTHLQDTYGHVPVSRLRDTITTPTGAERAQGKAWDDAGGMVGYFEADKKGTTPHKQFEAFSKAWMKKAASDPKHPDHEDAKRLLAMKPLRSNKMVSGRDAATEESLTKHFDSIGDYDLEQPVKEKMPEKAKYEDQPPVREPPSVSAGTAVGKKKKQPKDSNKVNSPEAFAGTHLDLDTKEFDEGEKLSSADLEPTSEAEAKTLLKKPEASKSLRLYVRS